MVDVHGAAGGIPLDSVSTSVTVACSIIFFWLRVVHAIGMISGWARLPMRPMIYFAGWITMLVFAWQVILKAA
jgi:uncharacterized membrane protein YecN with MAPEG domain